MSFSVKRDTVARQNKPRPAPDSMQYMPQTHPVSAFAANGAAAAQLVPLTDKLCTPDQLAQRLAALPRPLVFTNGVFDVLHRGHVMYLEQARALGGSLLVALNTDVSAKRLGKGPDRPLNNEVDRACVIAALASSSLVTWFDEDTPLELIRLVRPDVLVKGGDYDMAKLAETALVQSWGGHAQTLPFVQGYSTTALVNKIKKINEKAL